MGKVVVVFEAIPLGWQGLAPGIWKDKTVADKLMYIPNDDKQNYPFYKLQLVKCRHPI